jgi:predicted enzyme related to lactoylglutathione lyase
MAAPVVHFEILGRNGPALQRFYRDLFDWKIPDMVTFALFTDPDGNLIGLVKAGEG